MKKTADNEGIVDRVWGMDATKKWELRSGK